MSLTNNTTLVTKIYFPKEIFPLAAVFACLFDFGVASSALLILLLLLKISCSIYLVYLPILIISLILLSVGISMIVSAGSLFFRDVKYIVEAVLTFAIFFTPVFYDANTFGDKGKWLLLNPAAPILQGMSDCVVRQQCPNLPWIGYSIIFALVTFIGGYLFFKHLEPAFAESV